MPANYVLLEKITVGAAGASSVTFSGIPQTGYTDLVVKISARNTAASSQLLVTVNGSTTTYSGRRLQGTGTAALSDLTNTANLNPVGSVSSGFTANTFSNAEIYIPNYTNANFKSFSIDGTSENNATESYMTLVAGLWSNTSAITSIGFAPTSGSLVEGSTFYLYGVAKLGTTPVIVPYATGGDIIDTDGTYWYHTFLSSGTFTPQKSITCDYLVVAGGGGADTGGGGAGGLRSTVTATGGGGSLETALSLALNTNYTVTIGAGGNIASSGSNSVFSTITSIGGGSGGGSGGGFPNTGGSGGGAGQSSIYPTGANGTANQGYKGGNGSSSQSGGGGGGAGVVGSNAPSSTVGGAGGNGVATSISGSSVTYGGGGGSGGISGGGAGGTGGGGTGSASSGTAGAINTGGGGGGGWSVSSARGGSGLVIVRYAV